MKQLSRPRILIRSSSLIISDAHTGRHCSPIRWPLPDWGRVQGLVRHQLCLRLLDRVLREPLQLQPRLSLRQYSGLFAAVEGLVKDCVVEEEHTEQAHHGDDAPVHTVSVDVEATMGTKYSCSDDEAWSMDGADAGTLFMPDSWYCRSELVTMLSACNTRYGFTEVSDLFSSTCCLAMQYQMRLLREDCSNQGSQVRLPTLGSAGGHLRFACQLKGSRCKGSLSA